MNITHSLTAGITAPQAAPRQLHTFSYATAVYLSIPMLAMVLLQYFRTDYKRWILFGQGTPPGTDNPYGYTVYTLQKYFLTILRHDICSVELLKQCPDQSVYLPNKVITGERKGKRPTLVPWILPQRIAPPYLHDPIVENAIRGLLLNAVESYRDLMQTKDHVRIGLSRLEGQGDAIQLSDNLVHICQDAKTTFNEVAHIHQQDLSFHVLLSPADATTVVEQKYGERFAVSGRMMHVGRLKGRTVPMGYLLAYTPTTLEEVEIMKEILKAAIRFGLSG